LALENGANLVAFSSELEALSFFQQQQQQLCVCFALVPAACLFVPIRAFERAKEESKLVR
jgi:hypothetical protein